MEKVRDLPTHGKKLRSVDVDSSFINVPFGIMLSGFFSENFLYFLRRSQFRLIELMRLCEVA